MCVCVCVCVCVRMCVCVYMCVCVCTDGLLTLGIFIIHVTKSLQSTAPAISVTNSWAKIAYPIAISVEASNRNTNSTLQS